MTAPARLAAHILLGASTPLVERSRAAIVAATLPQIGPPAFNHSTYRATEPNALSAFTAARTLPMMASLRLVELRDVTAGSPEVLGALVEYLRAPCADAVFVASGSTFGKVEKGGANWLARIKGAITPACRLVVYGDADADPLLFVRDLTREAGKAISRPDATLLVELVGPNLGQLQQEVAKLAVYVGAGEITADAIRACCSAVADPIVWSLTGALAERDAPLALASLQRLQEARENADAMLGAIASQLRRLLIAGQMLAAGHADREVMAATKIPAHVWGRVRGCLPQDPANLHRHLANAQRAMHRHPAGADRVLEAFVLDLLAPERAAGRPVRVGR